MKKTQASLESLQTLLLQAKEAKRFMTNNQAEILACHTQKNRQHSEKDHELLLKDFFSPESFIKRLKLHMMYICKSRTKAQMTLSLYYASLRPLERQLNLIDYQPTTGNKEKRFDGLPAEELLLIYDEIRSERAEAWLAAMYKQLRKRNMVTRKNQEEAKVKLEKQDRLNKLATPKDKFEKLRELLRLKAQFPSDVVVRRMIKEELKANPDAPDELLFKSFPKNPTTDLRAAAERQRRFEDDMLKAARAFLELAKKTQKRQTDPKAEDHEV